MLHSHIDTIMFGCLVALLWKSQRFQDSIRCLLNGWVAALSVFFLIAAHPMLEGRFGGSYDMVFCISLSGIAISLIVLYAMQAPRSMFGRFLNTPLLRHLGVISYSLYLWQQPFTRRNSVRFFPWNVLAIVVTAELSYWIIERPSFRIRDRLERTLKLRQITASETASASTGS